MRARPRLKSDDSEKRILVPDRVDSAIELPFGIGTASVVDLLDRLLPGVVPRVFVNGLALANYLR